MFDRLGQLETQRGDDAGEPDAKRQRVVIHDKMSGEVGDDVATRDVEGNEDDDADLPEEDDDEDDAAPDEDDYLAVRGLVVQKTAWHAAVLRVMSAAAALALLTWLCYRQAED